MDFYVAVTPAPSPSGFYASQAASGRRSSTANAYGATRFLANDYPGLNIGARDMDATEKLPSSARQVDATALLPKSADIVSFRAPAHERPAEGKEAEVSKIAEARIRLLAIKYANDSISAEIIARLEILNSRLIERSPRVTVEQINSLESSIVSVKAIEQSRLERAKRLGLQI